MDPAKEVAFFDRFETAHGDYDVLGERAYSRLLECFRRMIRPVPGERCIDLGCGTGAFTRRLARFGLALEGMDLSPRCVAQAGQQSAGERYVVGDIRATGLDARSFDIVVYSGVLHHFDTRAERVAVLTEGHRVLAPGGRLFAFDPSAHSPAMWLYRDPRSPLHSRRGKTDNEVLLRRDDLCDELAEAGFRNIDIRGTGGITFRYVESSVARLVLPLYNLYELALACSPLQRWLGTFLVTAAARGPG